LFGTIKHKSLVLFGLVDVCNLEVVLCYSWLGYSRFLVKIWVDGLVPQLDVAFAALKDGVVVVLYGGFDDFQVGVLKKVLQLDLPLVSW